MATGYQINNVDTDLLYVRKEMFLDGNLWGWGYNPYGALGTNDTSNRSSPVQSITGGSNWKQISLSQTTLSAIKSDGTLWVAGMNAYGQLGDNTVVSKSSPIQTLTGGTNWKQTSSGDFHVAAIKTDGTLWVCGYNSYGRLGTNDTTNRSSPIQTVAGGTNWKQVSCGTFHTAAIKTDGTLWTWGYNSNYGLGDGTAVHKSSPVQTIAGGTNWKQVSVGKAHTAAIKTDGTLWMCGYGTQGQIGINSTASQSSPVQTITGGTNWKLVSCGYRHTTAIKNDGTLWVWGDNANGELGDSTLTGRSSPVQTIAGGTNWKQVAGGHYCTAAIKTDGTLWCWGSNSQGNLGDGTTVRKSIPVQTIAGGILWSQVTCGYGAAALKDSLDYSTLPSSTQIASVAINVSAFTFIPGNTITCTALITYNDGTTSTDCTRLNWVFTPSTYVSISTTAASSVITALQTGAGTIRAIDSTTGVTSQVYNITINGSKAYGWGYNPSGGLGDNTTVQKSSPVQTIAGGTNWSQITDNNGSTIGIKSDGTLWGWGYNGSGQLGDNTQVNKSSPVQVYGGGTTWSQADLGNFHAAAVKTDGTLWLWGSNYYGNLGDGTIVSKSSPVQTIAGGTNWKQVSCENNMTTAIKTDGTLWVWGLNGNGQLGTNDSVHRSSPIQTAAGGTNWKQVSCGGFSIAAIKTDGTLWTWGYNGSGQLGNNSTGSTTAPAQTVTGGTNWSFVSSGRNHFAAIKTDGTLWVCGYNNKSQLGDNTIISKSSPIQTAAGGTTWASVVCGYAHITATKTDGSMWVWGDNTYGQLAYTGVVSVSSPIQTVTGGTNWQQVSFGNAHTAAVKTDGTLWMWGWNNYGQLGDNTSSDKSSPVQTIAGGTNWQSVACGSIYTAAIKTDGTLWMWGRNNYGQLGDNTTVNKSSPVQTIAGGTNWQQVSFGNAHTAAVKTDGTLWVWGRNGNGQLGDNTTVDKSSPVQTIAGGTNWKSVACGQYHTAAIKTDGSLWVWGMDSYGQLGDNTSSDKSSPVQTIAGGTNWKSVACGQSHTAAIKTDGTLWTWGYNASGQLGDNTSSDKSSPVQTIAGGTNWKSVACGLYNTAAIKTDGTSWGWGINSYGVLGDNTSTNKSSPVQIYGGGNNWSQVSCGSYSIAAIKTDGTLWGWGHNPYGQLGNQQASALTAPTSFQFGGTAWQPSIYAKHYNTFAINNNYIKTITLSGPTTGIVNSTSYTYTLSVTNSDNSTSYDCNQVLWSTNPSSLSTVITQDPSSIVLQFSGAQTSWQLIATDKNNNTVTGTLTLTR